MWRPFSDPIFRGSVGATAAFRSVSLPYRVLFHSRSHISEQITGKDQFPSPNDIFWIRGDQEIPTDILRFWASKSQRNSSTEESSGTGKKGNAAGGGSRLFLAVCCFLGGVCRGCNAISVNPRSRVGKAHKEIRENQENHQKRGKTWENIIFSTEPNGSVETLTNRGKMKEIEGCRWAN